MENIKIQFINIVDDIINFEIKSNTNICKNSFVLDKEHTHNFILWLENLLFVNKEFYFEFKNDKGKYIFDLDKKNKLFILKKDNNEIIFEQKTDRAKFVSDAYKEYIRFFSCVNNFVSCWFIIIFILLV